MSQSPQTDIVAHWSKLLEGFETSATEFYACVEQALARRKVPGLSTSRVTWSEGGLLAPDRVYLRITGGRHVFDICAAPFGTGYFFSSWMTKRKASFVILYMLGLGIATVLGAMGIAWSMNALYRLPYVYLLFRFVEMPFVSFPLAFLFSLWSVATLARGGLYGAELAVLSIPLVGWLYRQLFAPETYYRIDTMLMFQSAVQAALMEAIDGQTTLKGIRSLTEDERKPIFHKLA